MSNARHAFYSATISAWITDREASILVVAGGSTDHDVLSALGFTKVTVTNTDPRMDHSSFAPYEWRYEDAEQLRLPDNAVDYVVIHAGLHHLRSPHRGLTEMYRVARKGIAVFEARDSFTMRVVERLNLTQRYEHAAVFHNSGVFGGVNNTHIPNYVYRWTEREIEKTIASFAPTANHRFRYAYGLSAPCTPGVERGNFLKRLAIFVASPAFRLLSWVFPSQRNLFAAFVEKPSVENVHPWLRVRNGSIEFNHEWAAAKYKALPVADDE